VQCGKAMVQPGQQHYTYQTGQQTGYAPSKYPQEEQEPVHQPLLAYEQKQMPQPQQMLMLQMQMQQQQMMGQLMQDLAQM
jgi:hypothetical protein